MPRAATTTALVAAHLRDPSHRPHALAQLAEACASGVASAAREIGVPERTIWRWRAEDAELARAIDAARGVRVQA